MQHQLPDVLRFLPLQVQGRLFISKVRHPGIWLIRGPLQAVADVFGLKSSKRWSKLQRQVFPRRAALRAPKLEGLYPNVFQRLLFAIIRNRFVDGVEHRQNAGDALLRKLQFDLLIFQNGHKTISLKLGGGTVFGQKWVLIEGKTKWHTIAPGLQMHDLFGQNHVGGMVVYFAGYAEFDFQIRSGLGVRMNDELEWSLVRTKLQRQHLCQRKRHRLRFAARQKFGKLQLATSGNMGTLHQVFAIL